MTTVSLLHFNDETARMTADVFDVPSVPVTAVLPVASAVSDHLMNTAHEFAAGRLLDSDNSTDLTKRETEVMERIGRGLTDEQIGDDLLISKNTVGIHVGHILAKLNVRDRFQAVREMERRQGATSRDLFALPVNRTIERDEEPNLTHADFSDCWEGPENDADRRYLISTANLPMTTGDALQRASLACLPYDCIDPVNDNASLLAFTLSKRFPTVRFDVTQFYLSTRGEEDTGAANEIHHTLIESYVAGEEIDCEEGGTK